MTARPSHDPARKKYLRRDPTFPNDTFVEFDTSTAPGGQTQCVLGVYVRSPHDRRQRRAVDSRDGRNRLGRRGVNTSWASSNSAFRTLRSRAELVGKNQVTRVRCGVRGPVLPSRTRHCGIPRTSRLEQLPQDHQSQATLAASPAALLPAGIMAALALFHLELLPCSACHARRALAILALPSFSFADDIVLSVDASEVGRKVIFTSAK